MITPAAIAGPQYYKVGDWVTLAWNYTSLSITPSAIDIMATCTANQATYTLAVNQTVEKTGGAIFWDTGAYQSSASIPLLTETYTLMIYDSESSPSAAPKAGYLGLANGFTFGMYTPQPYVPWSGKSHLTSHSPTVSSLTRTRVQMRKLQLGSLRFRDANPQSPPHHQRHHHLLAALLRRQLRGVVSTRCVPPFGPDPSVPLRNFSRLRFGILHTPRRSSIRSFATQRYFQICYIFTPYMLFLKDGPRY